VGKMAAVAGTDSGTDHHLVPQQQMVAQHRQILALLRHLLALLRHQLALVVA
jgi:hypothetical protein